MRKGMMQSISRAGRRFMTDERGGEVLEYALILGLVVVVAIGLVAAVGNKVVGKWTSVNSSL